MATAIDRKTKTVREKALFSTEVCYYYDEIVIHTDGLFNNEGDAILAAGLILVGYRLGFSLGGYKSRGLGSMELRKFEAIMDGQKIDISKTEETIRKKVK